MIVRIHGAVISVPGLTDLLDLAHREGWSLVVISGVGGAAEALPRTGNLTAELASNLTSYFMAGGVGQRGAGVALRRSHGTRHPVQLRTAAAHALPRPVSP